ncbi:MAG: hypothetical protein QOI24_3174 [Acidobacteriota bacterium]|jgi:hypothetical protein|nr:hypothetical protein [Acidobacteriota bacterium]
MSCPDRLTITFKGICGHYRNVVPGVPHRVVLPDASQVRMGLISIGNGPPSAYYLLPHYVVLTTGDRSVTVSGIADGGYVYSSVRLQVLNALDQVLSYDASYYQTCPIEDYVPRFEYSHEVVLGGRAAAYFDVHGGVVKSFGGDGVAGYTTIEIQTDGPPMLGLTPFGTETLSATTVRLPIENTLSVGNVDYDPDHEDGPFDFLLHYLAAERGIPQILSAPTPGMGSIPPTKKTKEIADALRDFAGCMDTGRPSARQIANIHALVHYESCSDTRYP